MTVLIVKEIVLNGVHIRSLKKNIIPGIYMTCMVMYGNGVQIILVIIHQNRLLIIWGLKRVRPALCAGAAGSAAPGDAAPLTAAGTRPATAAGIWGSAWLRLRPGAFSGTSQASYSTEQSA